MAATQRIILHVDPNRKLVELHTVQQRAQVPTDDWLATAFSVMAISNHVCAGDYDLFAELFQVDSLAVAPYVLKVKNGGRYVLWVLDNDPNPSSVDTFELPNIHQVWRGSGYISFYNDSGCPTGIPLSYVQRIQRTIRWGGHYKQGSSARFEVELGPSGVMSHDLLRLCKNCGPCSYTKLCGRCKSTRYCSKRCQAADWKNHKHDCAALK